MLFDLIIDKLIKLNHVDDFFIIAICILVIIYFQFSFSFRKLVRYYNKINFSILFSQYFPGFFQVNF